MAITTPTADFVTGTLQAAISAVDDTATIDTGLTLPATNGVLQLGYASTQIVGASNGPETIFYTAYNDATGALTGIIRGVAGTTGVIHDSAEGMTVQAGWSTYYLTQEPLNSIIGGIEAWHEVGEAGEPAFENSWENYGGVYTTAAFMKDPLGFVHLKGFIAKGVTTNSTPVFTLPAGYRPSAASHFSSMSIYGATLSSTTFIRIDPDGAVLVYYAQNEWLTLDGITFKAA